MHFEKIGNQPLGPFEFSLRRDEFKMEIRKQKIEEILSKKRVIPLSDSELETSSRSFKEALFSLSFFDGVPQFPLEHYDLFLDTISSHISSLGSFSSEISQLETELAILDKVFEFLSHHMQLPSTAIHKALAIVIFVTGKTDGFYKEDGASRRHLFLLVKLSEYQNFFVAIKVMHFRCSN